MNKTQIGTSRTKLFLIELIIIITFFIVALTIIMRIFSKANLLSLDSSALNGASITMQSNAEQYRLVSFKDITKETQSLYYDKNWKTSDKDNSYYEITVEKSFEEKDNSIIVTFIQNAKYSSNNRNIFKLETKKFYIKDMNN